MKLIMKEHLEVIRKPGDIRCSGVVLTRKEVSMQQLYPKYKVRWIANRDCKACGHHHKEQHTFAFFNPEAALEHATYVLSKGHTLLSVDQ
jgi:hypothetical protein